MKPTAAVTALLALLVGSAAPTLAQQPKPAGEAGAATGAAVAGEGAMKDVVVEEAMQGGEFEEGDEISVEMGEPPFPVEDDGHYREFAEPGGVDFERIQTVVDELTDGLVDPVPVDLTDTESAAHDQHVRRMVTGLGRLSDFVKKYTDPNAPGAQGLAMLDDATRAAVAGVELKVIQQQTEYEAYEFRKVLDALAESDGKAFLISEHEAAVREFGRALGIEDKGM